MSLKGEPLTARTLPTTFLIFISDNLSRGDLAFNLWTSQKLLRYRQRQTFSLVPPRAGSVQRWVETANAVQLLQLHAILESDSCSDIPLALLSGMSLRTLSYPFSLFDTLGLNMKYRSRDFFY